MEDVQVTETIEEVEIPDTPEPSLRDEIEASVAEAKESSDDGMIADVPSDISHEAVEDFAGTRERDERGRFKTKEPASEGDEPPQDIETHITPPSEAQTGEPETPAIDMPVSWRPEDAELFQSLPRELQQKVAEREGQRESAFSQMSEERAELRRYKESVESVAAPYQERIEQLRNENPNMDLSTYFQQLAEGDLMLRDNPEMAIRMLAQMNGVDIQQLAQQPEVDPRNHEMEFELFQLRRQAQLREAAERRQRDVSMNQEMRSNAQLIQEIAEQKDENGKLLRPFFKQVMENLPRTAIALKQGNPNLEMKDVFIQAYEQLAEPLEAEIKRRAEAQSISARREQGAKARELGSSLSGAPNGKTTSAAPESIRDAIMQSIHEQRA